MTFLELNELVFGLCYICGKQRNEHNTLCDKCFETASMRMKKLNANPSDNMINARKDYTDYMRGFAKKLFSKKIIRESRGIKYENSNQWNKK